MAKRAANDEKALASSALMARPAKKSRTIDEYNFSLNQEYFDTQSFLFCDMKKAWKDQKGPLESDFIDCIFDPFLCWTLKDFLQPQKEEESKNGCGFVNQLKDALLKLKFFEKNNDLYQFKQSGDIKSGVKSSCIRQFREVLHDQVLPWLRELTGIELSDVIDASCSRYDYTDTLLCHDDELEGRRIAFIYYLVDPSWCPQDGGSLDLFNIDECGQPKDIVRSIVPSLNSFIFFEVTPVSFHQVSEILTASKTRLSISGWFHGPAVPRPSPYKEIIPHFSLPIDKPLEILQEWINPIYLDIGTHSQIREQFENESQIELPNFLLEEKYKELSSLLKATDSDIWKKTGPPNKRCINIGQKSSGFPSLLADALSLFLSDPFCLLLSHFTELQLTSQPLQLDSAPDSTLDSAPNSSRQSESLNPCSCHGDWYLWQRGNYTLMNDGEGREFSLEARLYFNCDNWQPEFGGQTTFIARNEDEELLSLSPTSNSLQLVYKDKDTLSFTKYINHRAIDQEEVSLYWYSVETVYKEHTQ